MAAALLQLLLLSAAAAATTTTAFGAGSWNCTGQSKNLAPSQCAAYGDFYDSTDGHYWDQGGQGCSRADPCACGSGESGITCGKHGTTITMMCVAHRLPRPRPRPISDYINFVVHSFRSTSCPGCVCSCGRHTPPPMGATRLRTRLLNSPAGVGNVAIYN